MQRIRTGDHVIVIAGKSKGHIGNVTKVLGDKAIVTGANLVKKHVKPNPQIQQQGGIITKEAPLHLSNIALFNKETKKAGKIGYRFVEKNGKKVKERYFKSNNAVVDAL